VVPANTGLTREGAGLIWQEVTGYGRRALVETTMCRYTAPIWPRLRARLDAGCRTEAAVGAVVLNRILSATPELRPQRPRRYLKSWGKGFLLPLHPRATTPQ